MEIKNLTVGNVMRIFPVRKNDVIEIDGKLYKPSVEVLKPLNEFEKATYCLGLKEIDDGR